MVIQLEENVAVQIPNDDARALIDEPDNTARQLEADE
jgi:hypothetical protein